MAQAQTLFRSGQQFEKTWEVDAAALSLNYGGDMDVLATPVIVYGSSPMPPSAYAGRATAVAARSARP